MHSVNLPFTFKLGMSVNRGSLFGYLLKFIVFNAYFTLVDLAHNRVPQNNSIKGLQSTQQRIKFL